MNKGMSKGNWRVGIFLHNRNHFGLFRYRDVTILQIGILSIGRLTGKHCHA